MDNNKTTLELNDFVYLVLATLANDSKIIDLKDKNKKIISLPSNYKQIIQNILCADNGWDEEFSVLINTKEYFEDHFNWEVKLASTIKQVLIDLGKGYTYDFESDNLIIIFTKEEVDAIMSRYQDEEINNIMDHFASLLVDYIYTREYQEKFYDYSAKSISKMHNARNKEINCDIKQEVTIKQKRRTLSFFKK